METEKQCKLIFRKHFTCLFQRTARKIATVHYVEYMVYVKKTLSTRENVAIDKYLNLKSFLKNNSKGYTPKKSLTLSWDHIQQFMNTAPVQLYLGGKVNNRNSIPNDFTYLI